VAWDRAQIRPGAADWQRPAAPALGLGPASDGPLVAWPRAGAGAATAGSARPASGSGNEAAWSSRAEDKGRGSGGAVVSRDSLQHGGRGFVAGGDLPGSAASGLLQAPPAPSVLLI
jgi:hypothetical protein